MAPTPIRLWRVELGIGAEVEAKLRGELAPDELARAGGFACERARRRFVVARGALRTLLGSILDKRPRSISIGARPPGKPVLEDGRRDLHFNVSHSGDLALICIARGGKVGVDLEEVRPVPSALAISRRRFSPAEASFVEQGKAETGGERAGELDRRFLRCWTRKEAVVKATGAGLDFDLRGFTVPLGPAGGVVELDGARGNEARRWLLADVPLGAGYVGALALPSSMVDGGGDPSPALARVESDSRLGHCEEIDVREPIACIASPRVLAEGTCR